MATVNQDPWRLRLSSTLLVVACAVSVFLVWGVTTEVLTLGHRLPIGAILGSLPLFGVLTAAAPVLFGLFRRSWKTKPVEAAFGMALWGASEACNLWALVYVTYTL